LKRDQAPVFQSVPNTYSQHIITVYYKEVPSLGYTTAWLLLLLLCCAKCNLVPIQHNHQSDHRKSIPPTKSHHCFAQYMMYQAQHIFRQEQNYVSCIANNGTLAHHCFIKNCGHASILAPLDSKLPIGSKCQKILA
jgi:hypothetical protein